MSLPIFCFKYVLAYLVVWVPGCIMQDLLCWHVGSIVAAHRLSCSVARGILVPHPGIEPMSHALQGRFLTTGPPGKSLFSFHKNLNFVKLKPQLYDLPPKDCLMISPLKTVSKYSHIGIWTSTYKFWWDKTEFRIRK